MLLFAAWVALQTAAVPAAGVSVPSFSFQLGSQGASTDEIVELKIKINESTAVAGFRIRVSYDESVLNFAGTETSTAIESGTLQTNSESNPVYSVYVCNTGKGYAPKLSGTILTFLFQVRSDASAGQTDLCACVDETCDYSEKSMDLDTYSTLTLNIKPSQSNQAYLTALEPSQGELNPAFSPDIHYYGLNVDSGVHSVTFRADAGEGGSVKVSRKSLFGAGTDTPILITVISADKKTQTQYHVTVSRAEKSAQSENEPAESAGQVSRAQHIAQRLSSKSGGRRNSVSEAAEKALQAAKKGKKKSAEGRTKQIGSRKTASSALRVEQEAVRQIPADTASHTQPVSGLTVVQNQMPTYLVGMLATGFCITIGIVLCLWFTVKKK